MPRLWLVALFIFAFAARAAEHPYSILQGATSSTTTYLTILADEKDPIEVFATETGRWIQPAAVLRHVYPGSRNVIYQVRFDDLKPDRAYRLEVRSIGRAVTDRRVFRTRGSKTKGRVALLSCMLRQFHNPFMWNAIERERPDTILITGDAAYLDRDFLPLSRNPRTGRQAWDAFSATRARVKLYRYETLIPTYAVWDDHDAGGDNVTSTLALMSEIRDIYRVMFGGQEIPGEVTNGPGVAKRLDLFGRRFILLDGRSFRDFNSLSPWLGAPQERWMLDGLQPGPNFLVSGSQFFGGYIMKDSLEANWPDYTEKFLKRLNRKVHEIDARVTFASGDVHFSEIQEIESEALGYRTYEITSSSVHSFAFPGHYMIKPKNPRRRAVTGTHNAVILDLDAATPFKTRVHAVGWRGNELFEADLDIDPCLNALLPTERTR